jgi:hypothetical protein
MIGTVFNYRAVGVSTKENSIAQLKIPVGKLLRWRLEKAGAKAPLAPSAAHLIELARPWWETSPERFQLAIQRLNSIQIAWPKSKRARFRHGPLPALIVRTAGEMETSVRILSVGLKNGRLQLFFKLEVEAEPREQTIEVTFVSELKPLFSALAARSLSGEYWLEAELSSEVAKHWKRLNATGSLPFQFILRPVASGV